jgi:hypothetical protein
LKVDHARRVNLVEESPVSFSVRFKLRTLLILTGLLALLLGWLTNNYRHYTREMEIIDRLSLMGSVGVRLIASTHPPPFPFQCIQPPQPTIVRTSGWPSNALPAYMHPELFERADLVNYYGMEISDEAVEAISELKYVTYFQLPEHSVSDSVIARYRSVHPKTKVVLGIDPDLN